ncbi:MAG: phosphoribosylformylglycinamidine synthase subunit PurS [Longimicrobiaceae bacterium]
MKQYHVSVRVMPARGILDPQGSAVAGALGALGFGGVEEVRVGKTIYLRLSAGSETEARDRVRQMCEELLANPVTEDFDLEVQEREVQPTRPPAPLKASQE